MKQTKYSCTCDGRMKLLKRIKNDADASINKSCWKLPTLIYSKLLL